ncbi:MAG: helix-turn-helix domain-containing protein [Acidobacteria bacterium]|nr:helix-turn-helix domain-containing protein [Acidobacteriota bacterium]
MEGANILTQNVQALGSNGFFRRADTRFVTSLSHRNTPRRTRNPMDRQTLSIMKACEAVGVSRRTIYNWISAGKVEYVRTAGGSIRIFTDTLWRDAATPPRTIASGATDTVGRHA